LRKRRRNSQGELTVENDRYRKNVENAVDPERDDDDRDLDTGAPLFMK
jgi:hypothetical protein